MLLGTEPSGHFSILKAPVKGAIVYHLLALLFVVCVCSACWTVVPPPPLRAVIFAQLDKDVLACSML